MAFRFSAASETRKSTLTPNLRRVMDRAMSWQIMDFSITQGVRSLAQQCALFAQGRENLDTVNALRFKAGMPPISAAQNHDVVTKTKNSRHLPDKDGFSHAVDCAPYPYDPKDTARAWMLQGILLAAAAVEGVAVTSGADFNRNHNYRDDAFVDLPHIEEYTGP